MILRGKDITSERLLECEVDGGKIVRLEEAKASPANAAQCDTGFQPVADPQATGKMPVSRLLGGNEVYLSAGMIDIQVNGFGGTDLESDRLTPEDVLKVLQAQWPFGVTQFLATITTGPIDRLCRGLRAIADAVEKFPEARAAIPGIHLEGPYFCPDEGPRGAHPLEYIRKPDWDEFSRLQEAARGLISMVTLAPEVDGAIPFIERLTSDGILAAIGHTNAKEADIDRAIKAGARISTHLGNGCHNMVPRHVNYLQIQMARDELWASLIADGHHLPPHFAKNLVRAKQASRCILTTDAMSAAGAPPGTYTIGALEVVVGPDRLVRHPVSACLPGSAGTLDECVGNIVRWTGLSLSEGLAMATTHPAKLLGLKSYGLGVGKAANLILFRWNGQMRVTHTMLNGRVVFEREKG